MGQDKQLNGISLEAVVQKRTLDQALNAKEFSVLAGISYSSARSWFRRPSFPVVCGVVFWTDFVQWRTHQAGLKQVQLEQSASEFKRMETTTSKVTQQLPERAARILREASC
jgi:hypothetical protein